MKHKKLTQDRVVYFINYVMLAVFLIIVLYPLIYIISCSFSSGDALMSGKVKPYRAIVRYLSIRVYGRDIGTRLFIHLSEQSSVWFLHCLQLTLFPAVISGGRRYSR